MPKVSLRLIGFDTLFFNDAGDHGLVAISVEQRRTLLTRDRALLMHRAITHGCYLHAIDPRQQLKELIQRFDLAGKMTPFSRCLECNGEIDPVAKSLIKSRLPGRVSQNYDKFWYCGDCGRVYWKGSHYRQLLAFVNSLIKPPEG